MAPKTEPISADDDGGPTAKPENGDDDDDDDVEAADKRRPPSSNPFRAKSNASTVASSIGHRDRYASLMNSLVLSSRRDDLSALLGVVGGADEYHASGETGAPPPRGGPPHSRRGATAAGLLNLDLGYDLFEDNVLSGGVGGDAAVHPLFEHGVCKWPGCEVMLGDLAAFVR